MRIHGGDPRPLHREGTAQALEAPSDKLQSFDRFCTVLTVSAAQIRLASEK